MRVPATIRWVVLALLGLLIAAGVSIAASNLASQQIGLASEPISAGDALAPRAPSRANRHEGHRQEAPRMSTEPAHTKTTAPPPTSTEPQPPAAAPPPAVPAAPSGLNPSTDEQDHGGGVGRHADD